MSNKEPYRTPADEPEPEWHELTSFEVEVHSSTRTRTPGCRLYSKEMIEGVFTNTVRTLDERAIKELRPGQRVRVILQILATLTLLGCSSSHTNDEQLFGSGGTNGEVDAEGAGGAAGVAGAGTGGVAGSVASGGAAGVGGVGMDAGPVCTRIKIVNTTYANNCGTPTPLSKIQPFCDDKADCKYDFSWFYDPGFDPASGCPKDLHVDYVCLDDGQNVIASKSAYSPPEAVSITLECGCA